MVKWGCGRISQVSHASSDSFLKETLKKQKRIGIAVGLRKRRSGKYFTDPATVCMLKAVIRNLPPLRYAHI